MLLVGISSLVLAIAVCCPIIWMSYSVFNHSPVVGILAYSQFMAIMNKAAMNIYIQFFV